VGLQRMGDSFPVACVQVAMRGESEVVRGMLDRLVDQPEATRRKAAVRSHTVMLHGDCLQRTNVDIIIFATGRH